MNKPIVGAAVVGVTAGAAHFLLPQPASANNVDVHHRLVVGSVALLVAGLGATLLTKDKQYFGLSALLALLMVGSYKLSQKLDAKYA